MIFPDAALGTPWEDFSGSISMKEKAPRGTG
jgi:hypothetical protein